MDIEKWAQLKLTPIVAIHFKQRFLTSIKEKKAAWTITKHVVELDG